METEYMNGGIAVNILKLAIEQGYVPDAQELCMIARHDAMPRNVFYTMPAQVQSPQEKWDSIKDGYEDLYGEWTPQAPKRRSAYDKKHYPR